MGDAWIYHYENGVHFSNDEFDNIVPLEAIEEKCTAVDLEIKWMWLIWRCPANQRWATLSDDEENPESENIEINLSKNKKTLITLHE